MGFDTYLLVDGDVLLDWRKHASPLPRLLFRHDQVEMNVRLGADREDSEDPVQVRYRTTASGALENLEAAGFGWSATVAAYDEVRLIRGGASGILMAELWAARNEDEDLAEPENDETSESLRRAEQTLQQFLAVPPEVDLERLGRVMLHTWTDPAREEPFLIGDLSYDGDLPTAHEASWQAWRIAHEAGIPDSHAAARAAESLAVLDRSAPLLAWPIVLCTFLRALPATAEIALDLSEDASQYATDDHFHVEQYATKYWESATESLVGEARVMGRLWGVLAAFDNNLGREYWFARATDLMTRSRIVSSDSERTAKEKGDALELLVEAVLRTEEPELVVVEKNLRTDVEEVDLVVTNSLNDPFWIAHRSPLLLIECKNWSARVGIDELRVFESKIKDRGALCRVGIFVGLSGFTEPFLKRLRAFHAADGVIFAVDGNDLEKLIAAKTRLSEWLRSDGILRSLGGRAGFSRS